MTRTDLLECLGNGESSGVAFMRDAMDDYSVARELVAFANLRGGRLILGVEKDGTVHGLGEANAQSTVATRTYDRLDERVKHACRELVRPRIFPRIDVLRTAHPGRDVAVVEVDAGANACYVRHEQGRAYYVRVGRRSRELSLEELESLLRRRAARIETKPVPGSSIVDLDERRLADYFQRIRSQPFPADERERLSLLANTGILHADPRCPAKVAGLLLFGKHPGHFLPQAGIEATVCGGVDREQSASTRTSLRGPMTALRAADGFEREPGLVEQALAFVRRSTTVRRGLEEAPRDGERWDWPEEVLRELIVNALVHRDYGLVDSSIEVAVYLDRVEIRSPGTLPHGMRPDAMKAGRRYARNETLVNVMRDCGYVDHRGMGIKDRVIPGMRAHNGTEPDLIQDDQWFTVRLWKAPSSGRGA